MGMRTEPWRSSPGLPHDLPIMENRTEFGTRIWGMFLFYIRYQLDLPTSLLVTNSKTFLTFTKLLSPKGSVSSRTLFV